MNNRIRLLIMTDNAILRTGGSERFLRNLLNRLPADRYDIDVLQLSPPPPEQERVAEMELPSVRLIYRPIGASYGLRGLATLQFARSSVRRMKYDIVQSQHEKSDLINALLPGVRGMHKISNRRDMGFQKSSRVRALFRRINRRFDRVVAPSGKILDALVAEENVDPDRCHAIANGVDTKRFHPVDPEQRSRLRAQLGIAADARLVGCVASFSPVKRHVDLIDAFAQVSRSHPDARLLLIGEGPLRTDIEAQIAALDLSSRIHLWAARRDIENILPALDVFTLASSTEGMSNAILEAQACGVPVVATAVGGNPDLVESGRNGLLVPARSPDALATALGDLLGNTGRAREMGAEARARVEREHSLEAMALAYDRMYCELTRAS